MAESLAEDGFSNGSLIMVGGSDGLMMESIWATEVSWESAFNQGYLSRDLEEGAITEGCASEMAFSSSDGVLTDTVLFDISAESF
jgi:hypothetical protein